MARKIRSTQEAIGEAPAEPLPAGGVVFANNSPNREFVFAEGKKHKFKGTREIITDADLIAHLDTLAKTDRTIFRIDAEVETEQPEPDPIDPVDPEEPTEENTAPEQIL